MLVDCVVGVEFRWRFEFVEIFFFFIGDFFKMSVMWWGFLSGLCVEVYVYVGNYV